MANIRMQIILSLALMVFIMVMVGALAFLGTSLLNKSVTSIIDENVSSLEAAQELEIAILNQRGLVANYLLNGNKEWLFLLEKREEDFKRWYFKALEAAATEEEEHILEQIKDLYSHYDELRDQVIQLYNEKQTIEAKNLLLSDVWLQTNLLYEKTEDLIFANKRFISRATALINQNSMYFVVFIWIMILITLILGAILGIFYSKRINENISRSQKLAALGQLTASITHEIRTPLSVIRSTVHILHKKVNKNELFQKELQKINLEINRIEDIVRHFLDFSRIYQPSYSLIDIHSLLKEVITLVSPKAHDVHVEIKEYFNAESFVLKIDKEQIRQVFLNLLLNAIDSMPSGGEMDIVTKTDEKHFEVQVRDTGYGMSPDIQKKIFEPFFTTKSGGTGLGLFLVYKMINSHHGDIRVKSKPGKGTVFYVRLPLFDKSLA